MRLAVVLDVPVEPARVACRSSTLPIPTARLLWYKRPLNVTSGLGPVSCTKREIWTGSQP
jgi:hypothetical protein